jgi:N-acetylmuramoyl-L-alanine amidase
MRKITALLLSLISLSAGAASKVEAVHFTAAADASRLVVDLSKSTNYKVFSLAKPLRVVIDLSDARLRAPLPSNFSGSPVQALRSGIRNGRDLRMVADLSAKVAVKSFVLQPTNQGYQLVVELTTASGTHQAARAVATQTQTQAQAQAQAKKTTVAAVVAPARRAVAAPIAATSPVSPPVADPSAGGLRDIVVAIDAGHGGVDPGARGPHGIREKDVTLAIARQVQDQLNAEPGIKPILIRDGDYFVPLRGRVAKAREDKADLFISIHADAINDPSVKGSSVYILSDRGASSEAARWLAEKENAADLVGGVSLDNKDDVLKSVLIDLSQTATIEASAKVGNEVLHELRGVGRLHRHNLEQASFVVLKAPDIPSMLVETAFISNPQEERNLQSPAYQKRLAAAIVEGVRDYFRTDAPPGTKVALANSRRKHVIARGETLSTIADQYGVSVDTLRASNNLSGDRLYVGTVLRIPSSNGT